AYDLSTDSKGNEVGTGKLTSATDANGKMTTAQYNDPLDRLTNVSRPDGGSTSYQYSDSPGNVSVTTTTAEDASQSIVTVKVFDGLGRATGTQTDESGASTISTAQSYDGMGRVSQVSNPYRASDTILYTATAYDALSRVTSVTGTDSSTVNTYYSGNQTLVADQAGKERMSQADALGRLTDVYEITTQNNGVQGSPVPVAAMTEGITFPGRSEVANAYHTTYKYDALGDLMNVSQGPFFPGESGNPPPRIHSRNFTYDSLKRLLTAQNPESGTITYTYDLNGNLATKTDQRSPAVKITYAYDNLNRITGRSYSDVTPAVSYVYDGVGLSGAPNFKGRLTKMSSTVNGTTYENDYNSYDVMGRVTGYTQNVGSQGYPTSYGYNLAGALTSETYPSNRVVNTQYDTVGRLQTLSSGATTYESNLSYAAFGGVLSVQLGNTLTEADTYNQRLQPSELKLGPSGNLFDLTYGYTSTSNGTFDNGSNNGNVREEKLTITGSTTNTWDQKYTYDPLNRIASATETYNTNTQTWARNFLYDCFGNMWVTQPTQGGYGIGPTPLRPQDPGAYATNNQLINGAGSGALTTYDGVGNLPTDQSGNTYSYDGDNLMTSCTVSPTGLTSPGITSTYTYDGDGHRIAKSASGEATTTFVYDVFGKLIAEYGGPAPVNPGSSTSYLTTDHLGSTRVVTNQGGTVVAYHDYLPFGEEISSQTDLAATHRAGVAGYGASDDTAQKFTSKERDAESNLDYFWARYYSSSQGRFT
ncbi:MAG: RHS repeat domain-containing protein, partial [Blastocatellia bacterium]